MNPRAPELSALMTILRLVGPVISTRRSCSASGTGATVKSSGAVTKSSAPPASSRDWSSARASSSSRRRAVELLVEPSHERHRAVRQNLVVAVLLRCPDLHAITSSSASCR